MTILGWIAGFLLILIGLGWFLYLYLQYGFNRLSRAEAELMRRDGLFPGEPEYMRDFRVARAEWDIVDVGKHIKVAVAFIAIGATIILYLVLR